MFREKKQYGQDPDVVVRSKTTFNDPLKWKEPTTIFTCSWSDFFIKEADAWRNDAWDIILATPWHLYLILTKRIDRAIDCLPKTWPLPNVMIGVSAEDHKTARNRINKLFAFPARRFVSLEPLLGDVGDLSYCLPGTDAILRGFDEDTVLSEKIERCNAIADRRLDWVIVGGESGGTNARPMHPDWARSVRDQCVAAGVPFHFKQWGEWAPEPLNLSPGETAERDGALLGVDLAGQFHSIAAMQAGVEGAAWMRRVGRKAAGRLLDGVEWNAVPELPKVAA